MKLLYQGVDVSNFHPVNDINRMRQFLLPLDFGFFRELSSKRSPPDRLFQRAEPPRRRQFCSNFSVIRASPQSLQTNGATSESDSASTFETLRAIHLKHKEML
jgi:hypothetical protein